jgi:hypothetical protein
MSAEHLPYLPEQGDLDNLIIITPQSWRVLFLVGAMGPDLELDASAMEFLPLAAEFDDLIGSNEQLRVTRDEDTTNQYVDWRVTGHSQEAALWRASDQTAQALRSLGIVGATIKSARASNDAGLFDREPHVAWPDMVVSDEFATDL